MTIKERGDDAMRTRSALELLKPVYRQEQRTTGLIIIPTIIGRVSIGEVNRPGALNQDWKEDTNIHISRQKYVESKDESTVSTMWRPT